MHSKIRLKDIIECNIPDSNDDQMRIQQRYLRNHQKMFESLSSTLTTRPITFAKFSFKKAEVEADDQLRPIVHGIYQHSKQGSMLTSELWSKKQSRQFLKQADLETSKGVLKRFAHWEWDQNTNKERFKDLAEKQKQNTYTNESELVTKLQLGTIQGEKRLRQKIIRDWKLFRNYDIEGGLEKYKDSELPKVQKKKLHQSFGMSQRHVVKSQKLDDILNQLFDLHEDTKRDKQQFTKLVEAKPSNKKHHYQKSAFFAVH